MTTSTDTYKEFDGRLQHGNPGFPGTFGRAPLFGAFFFHLPIAMNGLFQKPKKGRENEYSSESGVSNLPVGRVAAFTLPPAFRAPEILFSA